MQPGRNSGHGPGHLSGLPPHMDPREDAGHMIAQELEVSLHMAFVEARQKRHEFITVEHLLLALLDNPTAAEVLRACGANLEDLRKHLTESINAHTPRIASDR